MYHELRKRGTSDMLAPIASPCGTAFRRGRRQQDPPMTTDAMQQKAAAVPQTGVAARAGDPRGAWTGPTAGPRARLRAGQSRDPAAALASDFMRFCQLNPKPCPLLAVGAPGDPQLPSLGDDLDIRTDVPRYRVFEQRRTDRRAARHPQALARRPRHLRARLLVLVRGCADPGRHRTAPHHPAMRVPMYRTSRSRPPPPARSTVRSWSRCGR